MMVDRREIAERVQERWADFVERGQMATFSKGQVLFYEGHLPMGAYLLWDGEIALQGGGVGDEAVVLSAKDHPVVGPDFLYSNTPFPFTARALSDVKIVFIARTDFLGLLEQPVRPLHS